LKTLAAIVVLSLVGGSALADSPPVALRIESLMVPPATGPIMFVQVKNLLEEPYEGSLSIKTPEGWLVTPRSRKVSLKAKELRRVPFTIERAANTDANTYTIEVAATAAGKQKVIRKQSVAAASAPYFKPTIDGQVDEWKDSLPVAFSSAGKRSVISTYWNRRKFCILIAVEEDELLPYKKGGPFDAVQVAISPQDTTTGTTKNADADRFEFLFVATGNGTEGKCFKLATPDVKLAETSQRRELDGLVYEDAKVAVSRRAGTTYYECSIPFSPMRGAIRPSEGRELFLSVLVHDVDGTGVRDWGQAAGMWPCQRNRLAWSDFVGAKWGDRPPFDNKLYWGLCASKH
jgi:hypothetical protein